MSNPFANRIVGYVVKPASELTANPANWRKHPAKQRAAVQASLRELGWIAAVIENTRSGLLIDGHERVMQAMAKGETVPVLQVDLSPEEEALALATFDPITYMAETDAAALDALLRQVNTGEESLQALLAEMADNAGLDYGKAEAIEDVEPQIDRAEELRVKWNVESGQMWQMDNHRLICGDCTDKAVVERVMGGEKAELAPVDPPYNVGFDYDGSTVDDNKAAEAYEQFSRAWFGVCQSVSERQIVTPGCYNLALWMRWFDPYHWAPWTKTNSMTNGRTSRFWCWEPVLFFGSGFGKSRSNDIFDFPIGQQKDVGNHPCPKPLKMWVDLVTNYSKPGAIIFESFSGSGTTIIACEQLGRRCRAVEISPGYVAVALERWATATGKTPVLL